MSRLLYFEKNSTMPFGLFEETKPKDTLKFVKAGLRIPSNRLSDIDFKQGNVLNISFDKKSIILTKKD